MRGRVARNLAALCIALRLRFAPVIESETIEGAHVRSPLLQAPSQASETRKNGQTRTLNSSPGRQMIVYT